MKAEILCGKEYIEYIDFKVLPRSGDVLELRGFVDNEGMFKVDYVSHTITASQSGEEKQYIKVHVRPK